jgi:hypothetical protein
MAYLILLAAVVMLGLLGYVAHKVRRIHMATYHALEEAIAAQVVCRPRAWPGQKDPEERSGFLHQPTD